MNPTATFIKMSQFSKYEITNEKKIVMMSTGRGGTKKIKRNF